MTSQSETGRTLHSRSHGFVVAMRAKLTNSARPPYFRWLIVSRWGSVGQHLSIGWTLQPALAGEAPIHLTPSKTSLAIQPPAADADTPATFRLAPVLPEAITVAGAFVPAEGYVQLYGSGTELQVRLKGLCLSCPDRSSWEVEATRAAWLGEFIEAGPGPHG